jgi:hypothetical protein
VEHVKVDIGLVKAAALKAAHAPAFFRHLAVVYDEPGYPGV